MDDAPEQIVATPSDRTPEIERNARPVHNLVDDAALAAPRLSREGRRKDQERGKDGDQVHEPTSGHL